MGKILDFSDIHGVIIFLIIGAILIIIVPVLDVKTP